MKTDISRNPSKKKSSSFQWVGAFTGTQSTRWTQGSSAHGLGLCSLTEASGARAAGQGGCGGRSGRGTPKKIIMSTQKGIFFKVEFHLPTNDFFGGYVGFQRGVICVSWKVLKSSLQGTNPWGPLKGKLGKSPAGPGDLLVLRRIGIFSVPNEVLFRSWWFQLKDLLKGALDQKNTNNLLVAFPASQKHQDGRMSRACPVPGGCEQLRVQAPLSYWRAGSAERSLIRWWFYPRLLPFTLVNQKPRSWHHVTMRWTARFRRPSKKVPFEKWAWLTLSSCGHLICLRLRERPETRV